MTRKQRDYKAEYARRIARGKEKGYSRAVARGHAPRGKAGLRAARFLDLQPGDSLGIDPRFDVYVDKQGRRHIKQIDRDKKRVFGRKIKRQHGEDESEFQERLIEEKRKTEGTLKWTSEEEFINSLTALGLTEREAYTHWFS